jgi:IS5 family transposase
MRPQTLAMQSGFEKFERKSNRELFLEEMDNMVPWAGLARLIQPHYPKGENGRPPVSLERMLRLYFLQQWFYLSDLEDAPYESQVLRLFAGIDLGREPVRDESTILHFRHLLEKHDLGRSLLKMVNEYLALCGVRSAECGVRIATGTIVDATLIHAPSSTKK